MLDPEGILHLTEDRILSRTEANDPVKSLTRVIPFDYN